MRSVYLSAGHSGTDPGAVAFGRREADIALDMREMVSLYLHRAGVPHDTDGAGRDNRPLREAVQEARQHPIAVEFHCNAAAARSATGVESLQAPADTLLGERLCQAVANGLQIRNRGAKPENAGQHHRLAFVSQGGGVILELFFITNPADLAAWDARRWLAARAVAEVLIAEASR